MELQQLVLLPPQLKQSWNHHPRCPNTRLRTLSFTHAWNQINRSTLLHGKCPRFLFFFPPIEKATETVDTPFSSSSSSWCSPTNNLFSFSHYLETLVLIPHYRRHSAVPPPNPPNLRRPGPSHCRGLTGMAPLVSISQLLRQPSSENRLLRRSEWRKLMCSPFLAPRFWTSLRNVQK